MSTVSLALLCGVVIFAAFVQGAMGVGFALIVAPVISLIEPRLLPVSLLVLMLPLNLFVLWRERGHIDLAGAKWITIGRVGGTLGGLWVLSALSQHQLNAFVGLATIAAVVLTLAMPAFNPARPAFLASGVVTGITETATGIGGPPLALVYQHHAPSVMRSTVALCFLTGEVISLVLLFAAHRVEVMYLQVAVELLPALVIGVLWSQAVHRRVNGRFLRGFVLVFAAVSGAVLLVR
jgi:uncharacterized membrane protein YfcA